MGVSRAFCCITHIWLQGTNQAIRYLKHCVTKLRSQDPAIHNYLISLLVMQDSDVDLIQFLQVREADVHLSRLGALTRSRAV